MLRCWDCTRRACAISSWRSSPSSVRSCSTSSWAASTAASASASTASTVSSCGSCGCCAAGLGCDAAALLLLLLPLLLCFGAAEAALPPLPPSRGAAAAALAVRLAAYGDRRLLQPLHHVLREASERGPGGTWAAAGADSAQPLIWGCFRDGFIIEASGRASLANTALANWEAQGAGSGTPPEAEWEGDGKWLRRIVWNHCVYARRCAPKQRALMATNIPLACHIYAPLGSPALLSGDRSQRCC